MIVMTQQYCKTLILLYNKATPDITARKTHIYYFYIDTLIGNEQKYHIQCLKIKIISVLNHNRVSPAK